MAGDGGRMARGESEKTEKITINLGLVDLGQIDLLVQEGFYANRTDFIRTAIRTQLATRSEALDQTAARRTRVHDSFVGDDLDQAASFGVLSRSICQMAARSPGAGPGAAGATKSFHRPLACWQRRLMMSSAPLTVQCMPDCFARWATIALMPPSM